MAAYQANYGFSEDGDQGANSAAVSSNDPGASESSKQKPGGGTKTPNPDPDPHETPAKEVKQKAEKRKADPGKVTATTTED